VRWYMPGQLGEYVPKAATIAVGDRDLKGTPDFIMRNWWGPITAELRAEEYRWKIRNGMNPVLHFINLPADRMIEHLPRIDLEDPLAGRFLNGQAVRPEAVQGQPQGPCRVYQAGVLLGVGEAGAAGQLQPARLIARG